MIRHAVVLVAIWYALGSGIARAQSIEAAAFGGYRFGNDFSELVTGRPVDLDGASSFGVVLDIPFRDTLQIEGLVTHQEARFTLPASPAAVPASWRVSVDHFHAGGLRELRAGRSRPFLTGTVGLTRYAADGDNEIRFSLAAGGGVKLFLNEHAGVRLDGRLFATIVDAEIRALSCAPGQGICIGVIHAWAAWQVEFTAGLLLKF
jgi:hypothetical protein